MPEARGEALCLFYLTPGFLAFPGAPFRPGVLGTAGRAFHAGYGRRIKAERVRVDFNTGRDELAGARAHDGDETHRPFPESHAPPIRPRRQREADHPIVAS